MIIQRLIYGSEKLIDLLNMIVYKTKKEYVHQMFVVSIKNASPPDKLQTQLSS